MLNSINYEVKENAGEFIIEFKMSDYGQFVEKGVSGTKQRSYYTDYKNQQQSTHNKNTNKQPPTKENNKWKSYTTLINYDRFFTT